MVPLELLTVPLDFLLIVLINGTPTAECVPMIIAQETTTERRESFLECQVVTDSIDGLEDGEEFFVETTGLVENIMAAFSPGDDRELTIQLATLPPNYPPTTPSTDH